jgi:hypothetical protein
MLVLPLISAEGAWLIRIQFGPRYRMIKSIARRRVYGRSRGEPLLASAGISNARC